MNGFMARTIGVVLVASFFPLQAGTLEFSSSFEEPLNVITFEPPVALQSAGVGGTAHLSGLRKAPIAVLLVGPGATVVDAAFSFDTNCPGLLEIEVPTTLVAGSWDLVVEAAGQGEVATLPGALQIVNSQALDFESRPAIVSTINGGTLRLDSDEQFEVITQVLLRPQGAPADEPALRLRSIDYKDEDRVFAPVPSGLAAGAYDVVAVNSDGVAGSIAAALTISANAEPEILDVFPQAMPIGSSTELTLTGSGFLPGATVGLTCEDGGEQALGVTFIDATTITADYVPGALTEGLCVVGVINSDGLETAFAAVRLKSPAVGIGEPVAGAAMLTARRAPALAMHRAGGEEFTLYAIGGDDGTDANTLNTVEFGEVGEFGGIDGWVPSAMTLPAGRSFSWAGQYGDFIYLAGGFDGANAVDTVLRAQILDAASAPGGLRHTFVLATGAPGYSGGIQAFRIAAIFPDDDPVNPGGQTLAGPVRQVFLPNDTEIALRLDWQPVPGASGYLVYTNASGVPYDGNSALLELVATTTEPSWLHNGQVTDPLQLPPIPGDTGAWHQVAGWSLGSARSHLAGAMASLLGAPDSIVLYAFGGDDSLGNRRNDYEYSVITQAGSATPGYGGFSLGAQTLVNSVRSLAAWPVLDQGSGESWFFIGTGLDGSSSALSEVERALASNTGDLGVFGVGGSEPGQEWAGASALAGSSSLALAGGLNGAASSNIQESMLSDSGSGPEMGNWNAAGFSLLEARVYSGTTYGSVFMFIVGGADDMGDAMTSVEFLAR